MTEPMNGARDLRDAIGEAHAEKHDLEAAAIDRERIAHTDKHHSEQVAVDTAIDAERHRLLDHRIAHEAAHASHEKLHEAFATAHSQQHASESEAVKAAVKAMDRRLDEMNNFRQQLTEQAATFARKDFVDESQKQTVIRMEELRALIATEREERRGSEGAKRGISQSTAVIVGAITLAVTIISAVIVVMNFATGTP